MISTCGAFITIAALIVDPFVQQMPVSYECRVLSPSAEARISRTNQYDETGLHIGAGESTLSLGMQDSINAGIFNPGVSVTFDCPTGNCTFPDDYHSVAYCSECIDYTNNLGIESMEDVDAMLAYNITLPKPYLTAFLNGTYGSNSAVFTLSSASTILLALTSDNVSSESCGNCTYVTDPEKAGFPNMNFDWNRYEGNLTWGCGGLGSTINGMSTGIGAATCSLFPCVKTYNAVVSGGRCTENIVSSTADWSAGDGNLGLPLNNMVNMKCLSSSDRRSLADAGYQIGNRAWIPYNSSPLLGIFATLTFL